MKPITVYWAPSNFNIEDESWNFPYLDPVPVMNTLASKASSSDFISCPAFRDSIKNVYSFNSAFDEYTQLDPGLLEFLQKDQNLLIPIDTQLRIPLSRVRKNSLDNHVNVLYDMSWVMFADEPLTARFTAPYAPATAPAEGAILASGQFDIGKWFRSFTLEYFLPLNTEHFGYDKDESLFYVQFMTDRKIVFKRFMVNEKLASLEQEMIQSPRRYGFGLTLKQRYEMFYKARMRSMILDEIQKNIVH